MTGFVPLKKDNRGYDLTQLLIGAEGTIGIVTAATLRLYPAILDRAAAWVGVADPEDALKILRMMEARTTTIESFEIIPGEILGRVLHHIPGTRSPLAGEHALARADPDRWRPNRAPSRRPRCWSAFSSRCSRPGWPRTR